MTDGHLDKEPIDPVYSGVISLTNLRLAMFLSELNNHHLWGANVGNAYLQALTKEKLYIVSGPEFEQFQAMFLLYTRHPVVQDLEEHVGMTSLLIFFNQWTSCNFLSSGREAQVSSLPSSHDEIGFTHSLLVQEGALALM